MTDTLGVATVGDVEEVRETATEAAEEGVETPGVDDAYEEGNWTAMGSCSSLRSANRQQQKDSRNLAVLNRVAKRTALLAFILNFPARAYAHAHCRHQPPRRRPYHRKLGVSRVTSFNLVKFAVIRTAARRLVSAMRMHVGARGKIQNKS